MGLKIKNKLNNDEVQAIAELLKYYPQPLVYSNTVSLSGYTHYFLKTIKHFLSQNKKSCLLVETTDKIRGAALLRFMEWDSSFFKIPIGCIEHILVDESREHAEVNGIMKYLLKSSIEKAKEEGMKVLYITINSRSFSLVDAINSLGFNFVCAEMEGLIRKGQAPYLNEKRELEDGVEFRKYRKKDYPQIMAIGKEIAEDLKSRFFLTPYFPKKEKSDYYSESIRNCCLGLNADDTFIAARYGKVIGFISYRHDKIFRETTGRRMSFLVIGGVLRTERRKNIGKHFFAWGHKQVLLGSDVVLWKAYLHNLPIVRFILSRDYIPAFEFNYTFCKKL